VSVAMPAGWDVDEVARWRAYHDELSAELMAGRVAIESALIPVTPYIMLSGVECYRRHPEMVPAIIDAMAPGDIGRAGRVPGTQINPVNLWSIVNVFNVGRQVLVGMGRITSDHEPARTAVMLNFWKDVAATYWDAGARSAHESKFVVRPYGDDVIAEVVRGLVDTDAAGDEVTGQFRRLNAALVSYLFLLYFDTRAGIADSGPYDLGDGRVILLRECSKTGVSDFPWSETVASHMPYPNVTLALVLDGVEVKVNDWGTSITEPEQYLDHLVGFGVYQPVGGRFEPIDPAEMPSLTAAVQKATANQYRHIAAMTPVERIHSGAYVYFGFLRPFADVAGVAGTLDWTVPRASDDVHDLLAARTQTQ
jgi:hypothetical protein